MDTGTFAEEEAFRHRDVSIVEALPGGHEELFLT